MGQQQAPPTSGSNFQTAQPGTEATIAPYYVGGGQAGKAYENMVSGEYGRVANWGNQNAPTFENMFSKYIDVANREADRQASQIGETLGSRGALYSSANLQQQADMRQKTAQDIGLQSQTFLKDIEDQRQRAEAVRQQGMGQVLQGQAGIATSEMGSREAAMGRAWQDFVRRSEVPPFVSAGIQWGSTRPGATFSA